MSRAQARPTARSLPRQVSFNVDTQVAIIPANFPDNVDEQHRQNVTAIRGTGPWAAAPPVGPNVSYDFSPTNQAYYHSFAPQATIEMGESLTAQLPRPTASSVNLATWSPQRGPQTHQSAVAPPPDHPNPLSPPVDAQRHHRPQALGQPHPYHSTQAYSSAPVPQPQYPNPLKPPNSFTSPLTTSTAQASNVAIRNGQGRQATEVISINDIHEFLRNGMVSPLVSEWDVRRDPEHILRNIQRKRPGLLQETAVRWEGTLIICNQHLPWKLKLEPEGGRMLTVEVFLRKLYLAFRIEVNESTLSTCLDDFESKNGSAARRTEKQRVEEERRRRVAQTEDNSDSLRIVDFLRFKRFGCLNVRKTEAALMLEPF